MDGSSKKGITSIMLVMIAGVLLLVNSCQLSKRVMIGDVSEALAQRDEAIFALAQAIKALQEKDKGRAEWTFSNSK